MSESYTAICDGGPNETDKHPIVYLDHALFYMEIYFKLFKGVK